ncbi:hypothetical protein BJY01DRAFT_230260, partial [Aspergillus pseudoustus]
MPKNPGIISVQGLTALSYGTYPATLLLLLRTTIRVQRYPRLSNSNTLILSSILSRMPTPFTWNVI